jgi:DNA-binding transcriptional MerR regulator/cell division septation protein DedD
MTRKIHFTLSEIAKEFKVKKSHIRSYEKKGLISPSNDKLGRRSYNQFDRARLELICHFEHIDYSPDQISELLGILDANLNKMEQFRKSLEYGEKKLDELEKRSKEIKFPDRISVINEINMMGNYIEELKNIESLNSVTEKKPKQKHIRMIPIYVGLSIIILFIAGYFFYQGGAVINLAQKKPSETEASPVSRYPVPPEDTGNQQNLAFQPSRTPDSPLPVQGGDSFTQESKQLFDKEPIIDKPETVILSQTTPNIGVEKVPLLSTESKDAIIHVEGSESSPEQNGLEVLQETALLEESESVKKGGEANLTQRTESLPVLTAGLSVIGTKPTVLPKPGDSQLESKKLMDKKLSGIGETGRHENEDVAVKLNPLDSKGSQSSPVSVAPDEKKQTDYKLSTSSDVKKTKLNTDQNNPNDQNYMVSLYYTSDENREIVDELARLLKTEGFDILGIKKVNYQYRDIRYFHDEDKPGALVLQKISNRGFTSLMNIEDINIKIKNLSNEYPNVRKGALELWTNI